MDVLIDLTIKSMLKNKNRTIVTIIAITLSATLMFLACFLFSIYRENEINNSIYSYGLQHAEISNLTYKDYKTINNNNIESIYPVIEVKKNYSNTLIKTTKEHLENYKLISGRYPNNSNEVITNKDNCLQQKAPKFEDITYKIVGCIDNKSYNSNYNFYTVYEFNDDDIVSAYIKYSEVKNVRNKTLEINENFKNTSIDYNERLLELYNESTSDIGPIRYALMIVVLIITATIIGVFTLLIIYTSYSISVIERKKMYGVLNSIGSTKAQIIKSITFEAIIEFLISIIIGFIISFILITIGVDVVNSKLLTSYNVTIYPIYLLICTTILLVFVFLSSIMPAFEASYVSPIKAIMQTEDIKRKKVKPNKLINKLFGIEGNIALKNVKRNKRKYTITTVSLVLSFSIFVAFAIFINKFNNVKNYTGSIELSNYDYEIIYDNTTDNFIETLKNLNIEDINIQRKQSVSIKSLNKYYKDEVPKIPYEEEYGSSLDLINIYNYEPNKPEFINERFVYILRDDKIDFYSGPVLKNNNIEIEICKKEDFTNLVDCTTINNIEIKNERILDTSNIDNNNTLIVNTKTYEELVNKYGNDNDNMYHIYVKAKNLNEFENELLSLKEQFDFTAKNKKLESIELTREYNLISIIIYSFLTFIIIFALLNAYNSISTTMNLRKREFTVLRSIGMDKFNKMILLESIFFSLKAIIFGTIFSSLIYFWMKSIFKELFLLQKIMDKNAVFVFPTPIKYMLIASISLIIITYIFMKVTFKKINKGNIADTLKEDLF